MVNNYHKAIVSSPKMIIVELWEIILFYLPWSSVQALVHVSPKYRRLCQAPYVWQRRIRREFYNYHRYVSDNHYQAYGCLTTIHYFTDQYYLPLVQNFDVRTMLSRRSGDRCLTFLFPLPPYPVIASPYYNCHLMAPIFCSTLSMRNILSSSKIKGYQLYP